MHYYQHNIGDYRRDTMHLSLLEHGVYRQLLDMYYLSESGIPKETQSVMRRLCARTKDEQESVLSVLNEFFVAQETGYTHARCDEEIGKYKKKSDTAKANGQRGGRPKEPKITKPVIDGLSKRTQEKANSLTKEPINLLSEVSENREDGEVSDANDKKEKKAIQLPKDFKPDDTCKSLALQNGFLVEDLFGQFEDFHRAKGSAFKDWQAAFRTWTRNAKNFRKESPQEAAKRANDEALKRMIANAI